MTTAKVDRYNGTTKEQRKMARLVAADVLKTMKYLTIETGAYCQVMDDGLSEKDIQSVPLSELKNCEVCARGAMYISRARLFNDYRFPDYGEDGLNQVPEATANDLGKENARLIECAFEQDSFFDDYSFKGKQAAAFGALYVDQRKRLRAIMKNVVENKGVFRPPVPKTKKAAQ